MACPVCWGHDTGVVETKRTFTGHWYGTGAINGAGFDSQYYDEFTDRLRDEIFDAASGDPEMWKIRNIINGGGTYLNGRYVTNYFELHDECWPSSGGQRMVKTIDTTAPHDDQYAKGRTKLAQGIVLTAPGIPATSFPSWSLISSAKCSRFLSSSATIFSSAPFCGP